MPKCGSQVVLCDVPVRIDSYKGCGHGCKYCFTLRKYDIRDIRLFETDKAVRAFVNGARNQEVNWCDWNIPLHWGGMSDPFQPIERAKRNSEKILKVFAESGYPFIVSTKGEAILDYLDLLSKCNVVVQISLVSPQYDKLEPHAPSFEKRLEMLEPLAKVCKRLIIRAQPYMRSAKQDIIRYIPEYARRGGYGIVLEGIKLFKKQQGFVRIAGDYCYPVEILKKDFEEIRSAAHSSGLRFYCGENRLRPMGDSLTCCGCDGLEGFEVNHSNLNHYYFDGRMAEYTESMKRTGTAFCFKAIMQTSIKVKPLREVSFAEAIEACKRERGLREIFFGRRANG